MPQHQVLSTIQHLKVQLAPVLLATKLMEQTEGKSARISILMYMLTDFAN